ncbi:MAG: DUF5676 family membrane protein [Actinobacteria bacterium]|nr:DUF5676 family membrane protein [Actinomycetota bacterium]
MKNQYAIPNTLAVTTAIVFIICRVLVAIFPDQSFAIAQSWFHGIEVNKLGANLSIGTFVLGLISATITAWIVGYIFIKVFKLFAK